MSVEPQYTILTNETEVDFFRAKQFGSTCGITVACIIPVAPLERSGERRGGCSGNTGRDGPEMGTLDAFHARYARGMHVMVLGPVIIIEHRLVYPLPVLHFLRAVHLWLLYKPFRFDIHHNEQAITFIFIPAVSDTRGIISSLPSVLLCCSQPRSSRRMRAWALP